MAICNKCVWRWQLVGDWMDAQGFTDEINDQASSRFLQSPAGLSAQNQWLHGLAQTSQLAAAKKLLQGLAPEQIQGLLGELGGGGAK